MIDPVSNVSPIAPAQTSRTQLGREDFLLLLVAQLKNQDPLSPLEPHEFAAQLAQFSSVEQLSNLNDGLTLQTEMLQLGSMVNQTTLAASLMGQVVVTEGSQVVVTSAGGQVDVLVGGTGGDATLDVIDASGRTVASIPLGAVGPGRQSFNIPGSVPPGNYDYSVTVTDPSGQIAPVITYTSGVVDGVSFKNGEILLRLNGIDVPLANLVELKPQL